MYCNCMFYCRDFYACCVRMFSAQQKIKIKHFKMGERRTYQLLNILFIFLFVCLLAHGANQAHGCVLVCECQARPLQKVSRGLAHLGNERGGGECYTQWGKRPPPLPPLSENSLADGDPKYLPWKTRWDWLM